jgi:hypothetical protein
MSEVVQFDDAWARQITERIRYTALGIRDGVEKLQMLVTEARNGDAHTKLGYPSWTAYLAEVFAEAPLPIEREQRPEVVAWLSGQGMPSRAIAPMVGVTDRRVRQIVNHVGNDFPPAQSPHSANAEEPVSTSPEVVDPVGEVTGDVDAPHPSPVTVDPVTGEVVDAPMVTEHTVTEKTRTVVGLDGKTYETKPNPPKDRRRSLVDDAYRANTDLWKAVERIRAIRTDDRFTRNKADVLAALQPSVGLALEVLSDL